MVILATALGALFTGMFLGGVFTLAILNRKEER